MRIYMRNQSRSSLVFAIGAFAFLLQSGTAQAQLADLQITEVLFNSAASSESKFEWVEVRNTGASDIDLNDFTFRDFNNFVPASVLPIPPNIQNAGSGGPTTNTIVPANSVAVLYNGFQFGYDDDRFRAGWQLPSTVPIIAVDFFPSLNNTGDSRQVGFWETIADYEADAPLVDTSDPPDGTDDARIINSFANAALSLDYTTASGYPAGSGAANQGKSITWTGNGDINDGVNWVLSESGINGATTSIETFLASGAQRNGDDFASPNLVPTGTAAAGLLITEIMVDPNDGQGQPGGSGNNDFEWIEVLNNTGAGIVFGPNAGAGEVEYVFDDNDGGDLTAANITSGSVADGATAVLFDDGTVSIADMETMWGPGNYIPVSDFTALTNGGDDIGIWASLADYTSETTTGQGRSFDNAVAALTYDDSANDWVDTGGGSSLYLKDLDGTNGNNDIGTGTLADGMLWDRSANDFGPPDPGQAFASSPLFSDTVTDYVAGDIGSPGAFSVVVQTDNADFNGDNIVNAADYTIWRDNLGGAGPDGDANGVDGVTAADYDIWKTQFGTNPNGSGAFTAGGANVPEPSSMVLFGLAGLLGFSRLGFSRLSRRIG